MIKTALRFLAGQATTGSEETHDLAYDLALIAIFAMLLFYIVSSSVIANKHVSFPHLILSRSAGCTRVPH
jgi:hypothetical protein